ncbi:toxin [Streptomyces sp. SID8352]|uniref:toxin n=1 Tax=Streptomyces sp. SID8352 TaxID=2690338 RepID=UPI0013683A1B
MGTSRQMRRLADTLIDPIRVPVPADPEVLFDALVASVAAWRGREVVVVRETFPPHTASGLWVEGEEQDVIVVDRRAAVWHQIVILCHEVWHIHRREAERAAAGAAARPRLGWLRGGRTGGPSAASGRAGEARPVRGAAVPGRAVAARSDFSLAEEQEADRFGMLMGRRLRSRLESSEDPVYAPDGAAGDLAGRIGAALHYRGPRG